MRVRFIPEGEKKIIVLSGAFSTGKSTMMQAIQKEFGNKYHYITDQGREAIQEYAPQGIESSTQQEDIQREILCRYIEAESEAMSDPRVTIADGSLVEVLAYSKDLLGEKELSLLNGLLHLRELHKMYDFVRFPVLDTVEDDGVRHTCKEAQSIIDKEIDGILSLYQFPILHLTTQVFQERYEIVSQHLNNL